MTTYANGFRNPLMIAAAVLLLQSGAFGQAPAAGQPGVPQAGQPGRGAARGAAQPQIVSPGVLPDRRVVFRLRAPQAQNVAIRGEMATAAPGAPGGGRGPGGSQLTKDSSGVWQVTLGPINPGAYRYTFVVDGLQVVDPSNTAVSLSNTTVQSLLYVPGADFMDARDVPHGAISTVYYPSSTVHALRRMHVYTPPGYEAGQQKYPLFFLLHGAGDSDDSWPTIGRAGFILDNLIASKKAKPMVVAMPYGHTNSQTAPATATRPPGATDEFLNDFWNDLRPFAENTYRILPGRENRAIAGLSMGGGHTLSIALPHLEGFAYIGVFSSGLYQVKMAEWEKEHPEVDNAAWRKGLKLFWFATGSDDPLMSSTQETMDMLKRHGFNLVFKRTGGAHTWINWREYLNEFAPMIFR